MLRPTLDFASVSYNSLLTKEQSMEIERLQLRAMKVVFGDYVSYRTVVEAGKIERLDDRRKTLFRKFALKIENNANFREKWLVCNEHPEYDLRRHEKYFIPRMTTDRGFRSPIINIRRVLNEIHST